MSSKWFFKCLTHCRDVVSRCHSGTSDEHRAIFTLFWQNQPIVIHMHHVSPCVLTRYPLCCLLVTTRRELLSFLWTSHSGDSTRPTSLPSLTCSHSRMRQASPTSPNSRISWLSWYVRWWLRASCGQEIFLYFRRPVSDDLGFFLCTQSNLRLDSGYTHRLVVHERLSPSFSA